MPKLQRQYQDIQLVERISEVDFQWSLSGKSLNQIDEAEEIYSCYYKEFPGVRDKQKSKK